MKKILLLTAGMLLIAASCTKNEVVEVNQDGNEIQYSVVANKATKAADIFCNNNMPASFTVYAESSDNKAYINGDVISQQNGSWVNTSGIRFWPNELSLDFYAFVNENGTWGWHPENEEPATLTGFTVPSGVADQEDFLYAVKMNQSKGMGTAGEGAETSESVTETTKPVTLNFRHALSQIVFNAKNTNPNLYVEISEVSIVGVSSKGNFTFPITDTDAKKYGAHNGGVTTISDYASGWGTWSSLSESAMYSVGFTKVEVPGDSSVKDLTTANDKPDGEDVTKEFSSKAMLLLPQTVAAWSPAENPTVLENGNYAKDKGAYFLVKCAIYNVAGNEFAEGDTALWGSTSEHKNVAIPVNPTWEQGKKYIYTFVFGDGGGYDPENPDPDPDDPDPVLIPVTFTVSVDDFVPVDVDPDIDMNPES